MLTWFYRNGWGATAVDALSTAAVMGEREIVNQIIEHVPKITWQTNATVSLFETTIRYMGGLLSGYDFLSGPRADLVDNKENVMALLEQAKTLADLLKYAFKTPSGVPNNDLVFPNMYMDNANNGLATVGTLILEWTRLTDLVGDSEYYKMADKAEQFLLKPKPSKGEPFPGLLGTDISVKTGEIMSESGSWSGGADSYYEYLIKSWVYDPNRFGAYKDRFVAAAESAMKFLRSEPKPGTVFLAQFNGRSISNYSQHLTCFDGGTFILGGMTLNRRDLLDFGLELVQGCRNTYAATATHIGPEQFSWDSKSVPADQKDFFAKNGFYINSGWYILRPEVLESMYYAYRVTGDPKYQEWSWEAFKAINQTSRTTSGFTDISNVNAPDGGPKGDNQESFFFAEVLKYAYLIQAEVSSSRQSSDVQN
jgi:mannosyl-oligosaccharide alpha-1,2-mannosidase